MTYGDLKIFIEQYTGLERDALHIHAALLLYFLTMLVLRCERLSPYPWLVVFGFAAANEIYDFRRNWPDGLEYTLSSGAKDLWNTMLWPTALLLLGRWNSQAGVRKGDQIRDLEPAREGERLHPLEDPKAQSSSLQ